MRATEKKKANESRAEKVEGGDGGAASTSVAPLTGSNNIDIDIRWELPQKKKTNFRLMAQSMFQDEIRERFDELCDDTEDNAAKRSLYGKATTAVINNLTPVQRQSVTNAVLDVNQCANAPVTNEIRREYVDHTVRSTFF
jgi:hypothetical protein